MDSKKRNGFVTGTIVGTLLSGCIFAMVLGILVMTMTNGTAVSESSNTVLNDSSVLSKVGTLQSLIDKYSLNEGDEESMIDGIYKGIIDSLGDVYSAYYTAEEYTALLESMTGTYKGIGITLQQDATTGIVTIVQVYEDGPAGRAGLQAGDAIYQVNGQDVTGQDIDQVVSWIKENDQVTISVARSGENDYITVDLTLEEIETQTVTYKMLEDNIGYIAVSQFEQVTEEQFIEAIDTLTEQGMTGLVIDLRNNPGGLYDTVVGMLDYILPEGLIVYTEDKNGDKEEQYSDDENQLDIPYSVIINGNSASASEIFAGAVKDFKTGTIVGTTSFGKGIVQDTIRLSDGSAVKLTVAKYYTPSGVNIHGTGITPDVEVELPSDVKTYGGDDDTQLAAAIEAVTK
jgi:carboxyl-terminal processing protease